MSFRNVSLGKLLKAIYADRSTRISMLRTDIRNQIRKDAGESSRGGGDFYVPFWADAKNHAAGKLDLEIATDDRVEANKRRTGLYPKLQEGFLSWWRENRRQINEPFNIVTENVKAKKDFPELGVVRIENTLSFTIGQDEHRIICPYFYEEPPISDEAARISLWLMSVALPDYRPTDFRILDVIRGRAFSFLDVALQGDEEAIFIRKYGDILFQWDELRKEY